MQRDTQKVEGTTIDFVKSGGSLLEKAITWKRERGNKIELL